METYYEEELVKLPDGTIEIKKVFSSIQGSSKKDSGERLAAENLLKAYNTGFKKNVGGDIPYYTKSAYLKQVYPVIKKFGLVKLIELLPVYFSNENYRQSNWAIWTFLCR